MEKKYSRAAVIMITVLAAVAAYFLRLKQLQLVDESGKLPVGAGRGLTWLCVIFVVLAAVYAFLLKKREKISGRSHVTTALTLLAAFCMAMGSAAMLATNSLMAVGGLISAVCWVVIALQRQQNTVPSAVLFMIPALFYAVELIVQFRGWSMDPQILDYCFSLLAGICAMCATFQLGGFSFLKGKRRRAVFYCLCGVVFSAAAMAGAPLLSMLTVAGAGIWLLANGWLLLGEA